MATWKPTYSGNSTLLGLLRDDEEAVDSEPVEDRLYPCIAFGDRPVADERTELVDDPRAARVESLDVCLRAWRVSGADKNSAHGRQGCAIADYQRCGM